MKDSYSFYKDKLNEEYLPVFDQVEMYLITQTIDEPAREDRMSELLDIFLSAQEAGKPVRSVTGSSMEQFCKAFCADFGMKNALLNMLDGLKRFAWLFVVLSAIDVAWLFFDPEVAGQNIWTVNSTLNIPAYFIAILIVDVFCAAINFLLRRAMFRLKRVSMRVLRIALGVEVVVGFIAVFSIITANTPRLFDCPTWVVLALSAAFLAVYYPTRGRQVKREKVKFFDMVKEEADRSFPAEMEKKFAKAQKRALKRGRELTLEQFLDKEEKDCNTTEKLKYFYFLLPIPVIGIPFVQMLLSGDFDSPLDAALFVVIQGVIEYALMFGLWKIVKSTLPGRRAWIAAKRVELNK